MRIKNEDLVFTIVEDTREQKPLTFKRESVRDTLKTGDYSIVGYEGEICFERKSIADLCGTMDAATGNRDRFKRELQRMRDAFGFYCIVIEGGRDDILPYCEKLYKTQMKAWYAKKRKRIKCRQPMRPEVRAKSVLGSLDAFFVYYQCPYFFVDDRTEAAQFIEKYCEYFVRGKENER